MEEELIGLRRSLEAFSAKIRGSLNAELLQALNAYGPKQLPDKKLSVLAAENVDLLHSIEQMLTPAPLLLADHFLGYVNTKCLCAAVQLEVPDILKSGAKSVSQIAQQCNAREDRLKQIMRALHHNGVFSWNSSADVYSNNATSELLTKDHWTQWRNWVDLYGNEFYDIARGIPASVSSDCTHSAAQINFNTDQDMFTYFTAQGWLPRLHKTLGGGATAQSPGILEDYPWHEFSSGPFLDIGGGTGALLALLLRNHASLTGALFDTERVIQHARGLFYGDAATYADVAQQLIPNGLIAGDFFDSLPAFEFYTMKWCLHDWKDPDVKCILSNIRSAIKITPNSRLVVLESILVGGRSGRLSRYADINMMMTSNGQERTEAEWRSLAHESGWEVRQIFPLRGAWVCALELRPAIES
ncbi:hypothetical protein LTS17_012617 [Exophiala oligosperma]